MEENPRYSTAVNIVELMFMMASRVKGVTILDIQEEFGVSRRTAERMKDAVMDLLPSVNEINTGDRQKHWGIVNYSVSDLVCFTGKEISTIEKIANNFDSATNKELRTIASKLKTISNNKFSNVLNEIELILKSEGLAVKQMPDYKIDIDNISAIREAIKQNYKIQAEYNEKSKILSPLGIIYGEKVYLIAKEEAFGQEPYCYLLHKLKNVSIVKENFDKKDFDLKEFSEKSFGIYQGEIFKVELEFDKDVREDVLNYNFHPTQKIKELENGNILVKFNASGELHIIWHLFKWGDKVKILKPTKLKKAYREYLENVLKVL